MRMMITCMMASFSSRIMIAGFLVFNSPFLQHNYR